jgi:hypothetical protein
MSKNLIEILSTINDPRRGAGQRHNLVVVLLIVIMATINGYFGYRAMGDFVLRNRKDLLKQLKLKKKRLPSFSTIRRIILGVDFNELSEVFLLWSKGYVKIESGDWLNIDGKGIKGTVSDIHSSQQNFINLVSVFAEKRGMVIFSGKVINSKESEIPMVRKAIEVLDIEGVVFTLDALHCQKKRQQKLLKAKTSI